MLKNLEEHRKKCDQRPRQCPYCRLELFPKTFGQHVEECGSRTVTCPDCKHNVLKKGNHACSVC